MAALDDDPIVLGRISSVFGVKGWVKIVSHTQPRKNIFTYPVWLVKKDKQWSSLTVAQGKPHGKTLIAKLDKVDDREQAQQWIGATIAVTRDMFAETEQNEYYWADLIGLQVQDRSGQVLGQVKSLMETGANDVLVVKSQDSADETLIPWLPEQVVLEVNLEKQQLIVDWDTDY